jgi:ribonuclease PH
VLMFFGGMLEERFEYSGDICCLQRAHYNMTMIATHRKKRSHADNSHQANFKRSKRLSSILPFIVTLDMSP